MKVRKYQDNGTFIDTDERTLAEAKLEAAERVLLLFNNALDALDDNPTREAAQWWAIGALKDNAGTQFSAWPAATQTAWNNQVQPHITSIRALLTRLRNARQAVVAATTNDQVDAVTL